MPAGIIWTGLSSPSSHAKEFDRETSHADLVTQCEFSNEPPSDNFNFKLVLRGHRRNLHPASTQAIEFFRRKAGNFPFQVLVLIRYGESLQLILNLDALPY